MLAAQVRRTITRRVDDPSVVDDLVQDVFVRMQARREQLQDTERLAGWVGRITRSIVVDHYRRKRPLGALSPSLADEADEDRTVVDPLARWVAATLQTLDPKYRAVLELTELQGLGQREAAERLGLTLAAVKSRVLRGRAKLLARLHDCCAVQLDRRGGVVDYAGKPGCC